MSKKEIKKRTRRSIQAESVAIDVIEKVGKGGKIVMGDILKKRGYTKSMIKNPKKVMETKSYQETITPVIEAMIRERDRALRLMESRVELAEYSDLVTAADKLTKNIQLLSGKDTEKGTVIFKWKK